MTLLLRYFFVLVLNKYTSHKGHYLHADKERYGLAATEVAANSKGVVVPDEVHCKADDAVEAIERKWQHIAHSRNGSTLQGGK